MRNAAYNTGRATVNPPEIGLAGKMESIQRVNPARPSLKIIHSTKCNECKRKRKAKHRTVCHRCAKRKYIKKHYDKYIFNNLKQNAKRRKKDFQLTFSEFTQFCQQTGYLEKKGQSPMNFTIDRIDSSIGYTLTNIQVLTHAENSRKGFWEKQGYQSEEHYEYEHLAYEDEPF